MPFQVIAVILTLLFIASSLAQSISLPPLIGFLVTGFALPDIFRFFFSIDLLSGGHEAETIKGILDFLAELGVYLLLFSIGLKLEVRSLVRREFCVSTVFQAIFTSLAGFLFFSSIGFFFPVPLFMNLTVYKCLLLGFALSFSSTVLAIKLLQDRGEVGGVAGTIATAVLVLQDVVAVTYLAISEGQAPSYWAFLLPFLFFIAKPWLHRWLSILERNEILVVAAVFFALVPGCLSFKLFGIEGELGALALGIMLSSHVRAPELAKALGPIKELLLTCYFLKLGLSGLPDFQGVVIALLLNLFVFFKFILFFFVLRFFRFRLRTSILSSFYLSSFSEFGLLVGQVAVKQGKLEAPWLSILALATAFSFLIEKPIEWSLSGLLDLFSQLFPKEENKSLHPSDQFINLGQAKILILGMGRVGTGAYDELAARYGEEMILGIEISSEKLERLVKEERNVVLADAADPDLWNRLVVEESLELVLLTLANLQTNETALGHLKEYAFRGRVAAIVAHEDERSELLEQGVGAVFNVYSEAGSGFATHLIDALSLDSVFTPLTQQLSVSSDEEEEENENKEGGSDEEFL